MRDTRPVNFEKKRKKKQEAKAEGGGYVQGLQLTVSTMIKRVNVMSGVDNVCFKPPITIAMVHRCSISAGFGKAEFSRTHRGVCVHRSRDVTYTDTSFWWPGLFVY